jgi:hypothetical protein
MGDMPPKRGARGWKCYMPISRTDRNQTAIVEALRAVGATVTITSMVRHGFPDLVVGYQGSTYLMECKVRPVRLTPEERGWQTAWRGHWAIVTTPEEALSEICRWGEGKAI